VPPSLLAGTYRQARTWQSLGTRTSTLHQDAGLDAQVRQLQALGCDKVFSEQVNSVAERASAGGSPRILREGDTFVVTKLDRLARSVAHLVEITAELKRKGVALKIVDMGVDTGRPSGRLFLNIVGSIAFDKRQWQTRPRPTLFARPFSSRKFSPEFLCKTRLKGNFHARLHAIPNGRCALCGHQGRPPLAGKRSTRVMG
jgi:Resolvase, N terminal domain